MPFQRVPVQRISSALEHQSTPHYSKSHNQLTGVIISEQIGLPFS
jgi:hypothetical protein